MSPQEWLGRAAAIVALLIALAVATLVVVIILAALGRLAFYLVAG